jgi:hypothetical protein
MLHLVAASGAETFCSRTTRSDQPLAVCEKASGAPPAAAAAAAAEPSSAVASPRLWLPSSASPRSVHEGRSEGSGSDRLDACVRCWLLSPLTAPGATNEDVKLRAAIRTFSAPRVVAAVAALATAAALAAVGTLVAAPGAAADAIAAVTLVVNDALGTTVVALFPAPPPARRVLLK